MDASIDRAPVVRINPGSFNRAGVETEAGEIEVRLSRYGNWMVHIRPAGRPDWRIACTGDMESGVLASEPLLASHGEITFGPLRIRRAARCAFVSDRKLALGPKEFELLLLLAGDPYRVFTKEELLKTIWGWFLPNRNRTLDSHASRLRRKLAAAGAEGLIVNVRGTGYRLCDRVPPNPRTGTPRGSEVSDLAPAS